MTNQKFSRRNFSSIYFKNSYTKGRKKRDVTVSFRDNDPLFEKCKKLGSSRIKELIDTKNYQDLVKAADKEDRSLSNYIKYHLRQKLNPN